MKITDLELTVKTDSGEFVIKRFGKQMIVTTPIAGLNKESSLYLKIKKQLEEVLNQTF